MTGTIPPDVNPVTASAPSPIGAPLSRVDGPVKVRGAATFAGEVPMEGLTYAALVHSTIARGRSTVLDTAEAEAAPGVVLVMTHRNAPALTPPAVFLTTPTAAAASGLPVIQDAEVHWNGQVVAVVLAETQEQADLAALRVRVEYEQDRSRTSFAEARGTAQLPESVMGEPAELRIGDPEEALREAPFRVDSTYTTPFQHHATMELHATTLRWDDDEHLTVYDATQLVDSTAISLAEVFGLDPADVRVVSPFVGGGFGGKSLWDHQILAAAAARLCGRPVRVVLTREAVFRIVGGRARTEQRVALGANADGTLRALLHTGVSTLTEHNALAEHFTLPARHRYAAESMHFRHEVMTLHTVPNFFMNAPGEAPGSFALESAVDELAHELSLDPVELRRRLEPAEDPTTGLPFSSRRLVEALERGADRFGWAERSPRPRSRRNGEWLIGTGVAAAGLGYAQIPASTARIRLARDGAVTVSSAVHEMGMGTATVQAQMAAATLGVPVDRVEVRYGDTALPAGSVAAASSQTVSLGASVLAAARVLVAELLALVGDDSPLFGLGPDDVDMVGAGLARRGDLRVHVPYTHLLAAAGRDEVIVEGAGAPLAAMGTHSLHSYGAVFCEVAVSDVTGETRVTRLLGSFDCGRIINAKTATSQFKGAMIMGLGAALTEETVFDERSGRVMSRSLAEYHIPSHADVPDIEVLWTDFPDPLTPFGARGIGEIGITGVAPAVANAVFHATGRRVRDLPITPDKLLPGT